MMRKFCPKCGKDTDELIGKLCSDCHSLTGTPQKSLLQPSVKIDLCKCTKVRFKNRWNHYPTLKDAIMSAIKNSSKFPKGMQIEITLPEGRTLEGKVSLPMTVKLIDSEGTSKESSMDAIITPMCCPVCSRKFGGYYESIIQLRGDDKDIKDILEYLEKRTGQQNRKEDSIFITKSEKKPGCIDVYMSSNKFAKKLSREVCSLFSIADHKESVSDYGTKDGKELKRVTYLLRCKQNK